MNNTIKVHSQANLFANQFRLYILMKIDEIIALQASQISTILC